MVVYLSLSKSTGLWKKTATKINLNNDERIKRAYTNSEKTCFRCLKFQQAALSSERVIRVGYTC